MKERIALLHYSSPPVIGGVEFVLEAQAKFLLSRGYGVRLLTGKGEKFHPQLEFSLIPELYSLHPWTKKVQEELKKGKLEEFYSLKNYLRERLSSSLEDISLVIAHNIFTMPFNMALTAVCHELSREKRFIVWVHDSPYFDPSYKDFLSSIPQDEYPWNLLRDYLPQAHYVTITSARKDKLVEILGFPEDRVRVIPNGIDIQSILGLNPEVKKIIEFYGLREKRWWGLFPARLIRRKNVELAIDILGEMNHLEEDKTALIITGPPDPHREGREYLRILKERAEEKGVSGEIIFLCDYPEREGDFFRVSFPLLRSLYLLSDFILITSYQEGFGIPVLEGGIFRLPVFASDISTLKEVGGEEVYYFSLEDSPSKIARDIKKVLQTTPSLSLFNRVKRESDWESILEKHLLPLL